MTKATIETYTVKAQNFEYRAAKPTLEAAINVAYEKIWPFAPDEKVQVYRGEELVGEIEVARARAEKIAALGWASWRDV